jgi:hypothetical protein
MNRNEQLRSHGRFRRCHRSVTTAKYRLSRLFIQRLHFKLQLLQFHIHIQLHNIWSIPPWLMAIGSTNFRNQVCNSFWVIQLRPPDTSTHKHAHKQMKTYLPGGGRKSLSLNKFTIAFRNLFAGGFMCYLHIIKLQYQRWSRKNFRLHPDVSRSGINYSLIFIPITTLSLTLLQTARQIEAIAFGGQFYRNTNRSYSN